MTQPTWSATAPDGVSLIEKFPDEVRNFVFDFSGEPEFGEGAQPLSPTSATLTIEPPNNNLVATLVQIDASGTVEYQFSGGASGMTYLIECDLALNEGSVLVAIGQLHIIDTNLFRVD